MPEANLEVEEIFEVRRNLINIIKDGDGERNLVAYLMIITDNDTATVSILLKIFITIIACPRLCVDKDALQIYALSGIRGDYVEPSPCQFCPDCGNRNASPG